MDELRNGLLPGRKNEEEPGLFREEPPAAAVDEKEEPIAIDSEIREVSGVSPARPTTPCQIPGDGSFGESLAELRRRHNFTIQQLAEETRIREIYLEALEAEDYKNLPQLVYVLGYIRKLCALYGVSKEDADTLTAGLRERLRYELPEDITKTVVDHEVSEENENKLRQLMLLVSGGIALVVIAFIVTGVLILIGLRHGSSAADSGAPFDESLLVEVQPEPQIEMQELK